MPEQLRGDVMGIYHPRQATARALFDRIIPPDDHAGAWDAGCADYVERQLAGDCAASAGLVTSGLEALDAEAQARFGSSFAELPATRQDELLAAIERAEVATAWLVPPAHFFATVIQLVSEGYYGDPGNGGNRDGASWTMIGYRSAREAR